MYGNCAYCGTFSQLNNHKMCKQCQIVDAQLIQQAMEILRAEGQKTIFELAEQIEVEPRRVFNWIDQGKISTIYFKHACPICGQDMLNGSCSCTTLSQSPGPQDPPGKFYTAIRIAKRRKQYWDEESTIRKKQKRDIWIV